MLKRVALIMVLLLGCIPVAFAGAANDNRNAELADSIVLALDSSRVMMNGKLEPLDASNPQIKPFVEKGVTMVPLRFMSDRLGAKLTIDAKTGTITLTVNGDVAQLRAGDATLTINGRPTQMAAASQAVNGTTYLPLKSIAQDLFHRTVSIKNGIILISKAPLVLSADTQAQLEKDLKPYAVYFTGTAFLHLYADGTTVKKELPMAKEPRRIFSRVAAMQDGYFYVEDSSQYTSTTILKYNLAGEQLKSWEFAADQNRSLVYAQDGYLYFNANNDVIKMSEKDASSTTIMKNKNLFHDKLSMVKNKIWFTDYLNDYAIHLADQGKLTKLTDNEAYVDHQSGNWIYYQKFDKPRWSIYRMTTGGGSKTKLTGNADVGDAYYDNNKIYYLDSYNKELKVMNLDGSNKKTICKLATRGLEIFMIDNGMIYFSEQDDAMTQFMYKASIGGGGKKRLTSLSFEVMSNTGGRWKRFSNVVALGDYIYFSAADQVYRMQKDGTGLKKVDSLNGVDISSQKVD